MAVFGAVIVGQSGQGANLSGTVAYSQMLGFGDSTMDTGWFFTHRVSNNPQIQAAYDASKAIGGGIATTPGGKMFTTLVAESVGLTAIAVGQAGGTIYAANGAVVSGAPISFAPSIVSQIDSYLGSVSQKADPNALYLFSGGGNELKNAALLSDATAQSSYIVQQGHAYSQAIIKLWNAGARYLVISDHTGSDALGRTFIDTVWGDLGAAGVSFLPGLYYANVAAPIRANPAAFGFTNTTGFASINPLPSVITSPGWTQYSVALTAPDAASTYFLADAEHLTAAAMVIEADYFKNILQTGAPILNEVLSVQNGVVNNGVIGANGGRFVYQWQRTAADGQTWEDIGGATANSYTVGLADIAHQLRVKVIYTEPNGTVNTTTTAPTIAARAVGGSLVAGDGGNNSLSGTSGNDGFRGGGGNDALNGGAGLDMANFVGAASGYTVTRNGDVITVADKTANRDGTDTLTSVERAHFTDVTLAFDLSGAGGQGYRIYKAAFNRTPDQDGVSFWINNLDKGMTLKTAAQAFVDSAEYKSIYGTNPIAETIVSSFYGNVLGRTPDKGGIDFWVGVYKSGMSTADLLINFSESAENQASTVATVGNGITLTSSLLI